RPGRPRGRGGSGRGGGGRPAAAVRARRPRAPGGSGSRSRSWFEVRPPTAVPAVPLLFGSCERGGEVITYSDTSSLYAVNRGHGRTTPDRRLERAGPARLLGRLGPRR